MEIVNRYEVKGKAWVTVKEACGKCGGRGYIQYYAWNDNGVCYDCMGAGYFLKDQREYTAKEQEAIDRRKAKAEAKRIAEWEAKQAERDAREAEQRAREAQWEAERIAKAQKSEYVGAVGDKVQFTAEVEFEVAFDGRFGRSYLYGMRDDKGNRVVYFSASTAFSKGHKYTFSATIKEHKVYNEEKQTVVQRATKVKEITENVE